MPRPAPLELMSPDLSGRRAELFALIGQVFASAANVPGFPFPTFADYLEAAYIGHSHYDPAASRIGIVREQSGKDPTIVTHFGVWNYQMRIGRARLKTGGIGVVATHPDHRRRGYMEQTARASLEAMRALGYDFAILFGIPNFYHRFGFVSAWPESTFIVPAGDLPGSADRLRLRPVKAGDRNDLVRLHNRFFAHTTGVAVRPTYRALPYPGKKWSGILWTLGGDRPCGYVLYAVQDDRLTCYEAVGAPRLVLAALRREARKRRCAEVRFETLPPQGDLAGALRQGNCRVETVYQRNGGAMICTINLPQALAHMVPELSHRLQTSAFRRWHGDLLLSDTHSSATLRIDRGRISVRAAAGSRHAIRGGPAIAQLLLGSDDPMEIAKHHSIKLSGDARDLLPALFPPQHPMLPMADRF